MKSTIFFNSDSLYSAGYWTEGCIVNERRIALFTVVNCERLEILVDCPRAQLHTVVDFVVAIAD